MITPALMVAGFGVVASVLVGPWGPAQALLPADDNHGKSSSELKAEKRDVESNIEATEDALAKAGKKVTKAVATFQEVNARWEAAKEDRREALDEARAAREEAQASEARAMRARQALRVAQEQKVAVERKARRHSRTDGRHGACRLHTWSPRRDRGYPRCEQSRATSKRDWPASTP